MAEIAGLKLIVPSSVSAGGSATATVSAGGKITYTNVKNTDSLTIEGCFSSTYDNYLLVHRVWAAGGEVILGRLRVSGSDASGSNYTRQSLSASSTTVSGSRLSNETSFRMVETGGGSLRNGAHVYIYGPNLAQPTAFRSVTVLDNSSARIIDYASTHSLSTAYTALTLFGSGATTMDGTIQIFGLSQ
jgi:hypothetical protein